MVKIGAYNNCEFSKIAFKRSNEDFEIMLIALDYQKLVENLISMDILSKVQSSNVESLNNELYLKLESRLKTLGIYEEVSDTYDRLKKKGKYNE